MLPFKYRSKCSWFKWSWTCKRRELWWP